MTVQPQLTTVSASRIARAEARRKAELAQQERARTAAETRYSEEHRKSEAAAQAARMGVMTAWPSLRSAVGWFKREWQAALPQAMHETSEHVEPGSLLGGPTLTDYWRSYLYDQSGDGHRAEPIRSAMRGMARSDNRYERCAAAFLFAMACLDFDAAAAGLAINGHCLCDVERAESGEFVTPHANVKGCVMRILPLAPEYAPYYAEQAIERLRERVVRLEQRGPRALPEPEWKARLGVGISESQAMAEAG